MKLLRLLAAFAAAFLFGAAPASAAAEWTQFRIYGSNNAIVQSSLKASWQVETGAPISASPTYGDGKLFIGNNSGKLVAIDVSNGRVAWKHHVSNALMSAPLIFHGLVIVGEGDEISSGPTPGHPLEVGDGQSALIAFDERSGAIRWRTPLHGSGMPTPAIINGILVHHDGAGFVTALDPITGHILYVKNMHAVASMTAALPVGNGRFITTGVMPNGVWQLNAKDGSVVWQHLLPQNASGMGDCPVATDGRRVFGDYVAPLPPNAYTIVGQAVREHAYALDLRTGTLLWDVPLEDGSLPPRNESGIPLTENGLLYIGGAVAPWVNALDVRSGHLRWRIKTHGPVKGGFVYSGGALYFGDFVGYLWAVDARTGASIGTKAMPSGFNVGSPILVGRTLIVGSRDGAVYAVPIDTIRASHDT